MEENRNGRELERRGGKSGKGMVIWDLFTDGFLGGSAKKEDTSLDLWDVWMCGNCGIVKLRR